MLSLSCTPLFVSHYADLLTLTSVPGRDDTRTDIHASVSFNGADRWRLSCFGAVLDKRANRRWYRRAILHLNVSHSA
ncbi:hypothetical protein WOLCODRAFT_137200 [Wolfiporia cocos MD-104 SS10]|uniref:Uncharacterized protein n=1 Tax=Wolfiporia cocos (strain MD-104) TaxID=742152 RepID=A0A2H3JGV4_WOLCO|nr:hypothetical protein WOLCODRAFT_137200 [Wolfiporia cocos MD-104 SS10]